MLGRMESENARIEGMKLRRQKLPLGNLFGTGKFSAVCAAAPIISASSFRDMQGIGIIPSIPTGTPSAVIQNNQLL